MRCAMILVGRKEDTLARRSSLDVACHRESVRIRLVSEFRYFRRRDRAESCRVRARTRPREVWTSSAFARTRVGLCWWGRAFHSIAIRESIGLAADTLAVVGHVRWANSGKVRWSVDQGAGKHRPGVRRGVKRPELVSRGSVEHRCQRHHLTPKPGSVAYDIAGSAGFCPSAVVPPERGPRRQGDRVIGHGVSSASSRLGIATSSGR